MGLLQDLLGGGDDRRRRDYDDFVNRYDQGEPWEGISDREAAERYQEVTGDLSDDEYMDAAQDAFSRLTPDQRRQFARQLQSQSRGRDIGFTDRDMDGQDDRYQDPRYLAQMTQRMRRSDPGLMGQLFGGGGGGQGGMLDNPVAKAAAAGIAAMAFKRFMGGRR